MGILDKVKGLLETSRLDKRQIEIVELIEKVGLSGWYRNKSEDSERLDNLILSTKPQSIQDVFSGDDEKILIHLLGGELAASIKYVWNHCGDFNYMNNIERRSFRDDANSFSYYRSNMQRLFELYRLKQEGFTLESYLSGNYDRTKIRDERVIAELISMEIDGGNETVFKSIKEIVYGDNNVNVISREMIRGLLKSKKEECWVLVGELLLAAKLQEGLRQTIVEVLDECQIGAFIHIYRIILDNNLSRFSSIVRAMDVWTGLGIMNEKPKTINKCLEAGFKALTDEAIRSSYIESDDNLLIYMALWAQSIYGLPKAVDMVKRLIKSGKKHKILVAMYFTKQTQHPIFQHATADAIVKEKYGGKDSKANDTETYDLETLSWVIVNACPVFYAIRNQKDHLAVRFGYDKSQSELVQRYSRLIESLPKKSKTFDASVFPWGQIEFNPYVVTSFVMRFLKNTTMDEHLFDQMLDYVDWMNADVKTKIMKDKFKTVRSKKQREWIFSLLKDRSSVVRKDALKVIAEMKPSTSEYEEIEAMLRTKNGEMKKVLIKILLSQKPKQIEAMIIRLLGDKNEEKRQGALDMLHSIKEDQTMKSVYVKCVKVASETSNLNEGDKLMFDKMTDETLSSYSIDNGFGLVDVKQSLSVEQMNEDTNYKPAQLFTLKAEELINLFSSLHDLVEANKDYEYERSTWNDSKEMVILGSQSRLQPLENKYGKVKMSLDDYPLADIWRAFIESSNITATHLVQLKFAISCYVTTDYLKEYLDVIRPHFPLGLFKKVVEGVHTLPYFQHTVTLVNAMVSEFDDEIYYKIAKDMLQYLLRVIPLKQFPKRYNKENTRRYYASNHIDTENLLEANQVAFFKDMLIRHGGESHELEIFTIRYEYYKRAGYINNHYIGIKDLNIAMKCGVNVTDEFLRELLVRPKAGEQVATVSGDYYYRRRNKLELVESLESNKQKVLSRILEIELKRGDVPTEVSHLASRIGEFHGVDHFVNLLVAFGKVPFVRGYTYISQDGGTKKRDV